MRNISPLTILSQSNGPLTTTTATTTTSTTARPTTTKRPQITATIPKSSPPDLCSLGRKVNTVLWLICIYFQRNTLDETKRERYIVPALITDWLDYVPRDFARINAVYQMANKDIVLIANTFVYTIKFPSLQIKYIYKLVTGKRARLVE